MSEDNQADLFDDQPATEEVSKEAPTEKEEAPAKAAEESTKEDQTGEETTEESTEPPSEDNKDEKAESSSKMIPEHRFKAAVNAVNEKLEAANRELATLKATPAPDPEKDPEGHRFHMRMETSKEVMRATVSDYDETMQHYKIMADANPYINQAVAAHPSPAKYAYDLAKKDKELKELASLKDSDEWKEFQEYKKGKAAQEALSKKEEAVSEKITKSLTAKVPNLNKATSVATSKTVSKSDDEELFAGAL